MSEGTLDVRWCRERGVVGGAEEVHDGGRIGIPAGDRRQVPLGLAGGQDRGVVVDDVGDRGLAYGEAQTHRDVPNLLEGNTHKLAAIGSQIPHQNGSCAGWWACPCGRACLWECRT